MQWQTSALFFFIQPFSTLIACNSYIRSFLKRVVPNFSSFIFEILAPVFYIPNYIRIGVLMMDFFNGTIHIPMLNRVIYSLGFNLIISVFSTPAEQNINVITNCRPFEGLLIRAIVYSWKFCIVY